MSLPGYLLLLPLCALPLVGCVKSQNVHAAGMVPAARVTASSKISMPPAGGQTIAVPQHMGDAHALWSPLNSTERNTKYSGPLPPMNIRLASWLPKSEENVMRSYLYRLTHGQSSLASRSVARAETVMPLVMRQVKRQGLPEEIACLPLVESAFQPRAVSPAGAAGLWQLMPATARRFGLTVNAEVDERFDVEKSTAAATAYLAFLYREFQDWPLAIAAYNCGEGKMRQALNASGSRKLSELTAACRERGTSYIAEETLRFVPQFVAAVQVMQHGGLTAVTDAFARDTFAEEHFSSRSDNIPASSEDSYGKKLMLVGRYEKKTAPPPPRSKRLQ